MSLLDAPWMVDVASGAAPKAVQVLAACHAEMNSDAFRTLNQAEQVMGALLEDTEPVALRAGAFDAISRELGGFADAPEDSGQDAPQGLFAAMPSALRRILDDHPHPIWENKIGGVQEMPIELLEEEGIRVRLLRLPPGRGVAEHTHDAEELTLVLDGGFHHGHADYFRGDVCHADSELTHNPRAHDDGPCICLTVEMGRLRFTHPVVAMASLMLGWDRN